MNSKEKYHFYKDRGICVLCHKNPAENGKTRCVDCTKKTKETYEWYKQHGFCVRCKKERACDGQILCPDCFEKQDLWHERYYKEHREEIVQKSKERMKIRYEKLKEQGICTICGQRRAATGNQLCVSCRTRERKKRNLLWTTGIDRSQRNDFGLCYVCAKPLNNHEKLCDECHQRTVENIQNINANPSEKMMQARENFKQQHSNAINLLIQKRLYGIKD